MSTPTPSYQEPMSSSYPPTQVYSPTITPAPAPSCSHSKPPNEVLLQLTTTVLIKDYSDFYNTPITGFSGPDYITLADGSLLTDIYTQDSKNASLFLSILVIFAVLFVRNTLVSGSYLYRTKVQKKFLFYMLFLSQILGAASVIPFALSFFVPRINCTTAVFAIHTGALVSIEILMTGILGVKAFKCLENSKVVFAVLSLCLITSSTAKVLDLVHSRGIRRLSGSCKAVTTSKFIRAFLFIQLAQSFFLCCCFFYAVWKSRGSPADRGRMSIRLSFEEHGPENSRPWYRGYLHDRALSSGNSNIFRYLRENPRMFLKSFARRPSGSNQIESNREKSTVEAQENVPIVATHVGISSWGNNGRRSHVRLFQEVMQDEVCYTATITASYLVFAIVPIAGINSDNRVPVIGWIGITWTVMSILAIHSFGRVIERQEREEILRQALPATFPHTQRRPRSSGDDGGDRFSDTRGLTQSCRSSTSSAASHISEMRDTFSPNGRTTFPIPMPSPTRLRS